jgi:hypothetical protein
MKTLIDNFFIHIENFSYLVTNLSLLTLLINKLPKKINEDIEKYLYFGRALNSGQTANRRIDAIPKKEEILASTNFIFSILFICPSIFGFIYSLYDHKEVNIYSILIFTLTLLLLITSMCYRDKLWDLYVNIFIDLEKKCKK